MFSSGNIWYDRDFIRVRVGYPFSVGLLLGFRFSLGLLTVRVRVRVLTKIFLILKYHKLANKNMNKRYKYTYIIIVNHQLLYHINFRKISPINLRREKHITFLRWKAAINEGWKLFGSSGGDGSRGNVKKNISMVV